MVSYSQRWRCAVGVAQKLASVVRKFTLVEGRWSGVRYSLFAAPIERWRANYKVTSRPRPTAPRQASSIPEGFRCLNLERVTERAAVSTTVIWSSTLIGASSNEEAMFWSAL